MSYSLLQSSSRTSKVIKNAALSSVLKFISIGISFIMVPITLSYLEKTGYGLWSALSSVLAWFFIFDIGIGYGLRNKFTELKANGQLDDIKYYISTAYFIFSVIVLIIIVIFIFLNTFIDWAELLNAPQNLAKELSDTVIIVFTGLCFSFILKLINTVLHADLKNGISDSFSVVYYTINLVGIIILSNTTSSSLSKYALLYICSNLFVTLGASIILFKTIYSSYTPRIKYIRLNLWKPLSSVGFRFFFIQIASLILFQTTGLILSNLIGPESVASYMITLRYYSITSMVFMMLTQPLWTSFGDAYYKNDFGWIKLTFKRLKKLWVILSIVLIVMLFFQNLIFKLWLQGRIEVDYQLSFLFVIFYCLQMWASIYEPFINSTSKLKLQLIVSAILIPFFIPLSIYLVKYLHFGPSGILISLIIINGIPMSILSTIQSKKIIENAPGIWNK